MWIKNSDGKPSITMSAFVVGFVIVNCKLLLAGTVILGMSFGTFTGIEYGASIAALGGVYVLRRNGGKLQ